ncbi:host specificity protein J, partial [Xenorhabdus sp. KJ12.1]|uniref:host specificity protein J n=1 Tax=Xenorhabdus sp. KJ12.1 TaxID=1851571 RepID=UPI00128FE3BC
GKAEGRTIQAVNGKVITVTTTYSETPIAESVWAIDATDLAIQLFRVTGIKEGDDGVSFEITAIEHNPDKYAHIDTGIRIDERPISLIPPGVQSPPKKVAISSDSVVHQGIAITTLRVSWDAAESAIAYEAEWRRDNGNWIAAPRTSTQGFEVPNIYAGRYQARVRAINAAEISSLWVNAPETHLKGKAGKPPAPLGFKATPIVFGIQLDWGFAPHTDDTLKTEIQYSPTSDGEGLMLLSDIPYPQKTYVMQGLAAGVAFYFRARLVDKSGNPSPWTDFLRGESSTDASWIIDAAGNQFLTAEAGKRLQSDIDFTNEAILGNAALIGSVVQHQLKENGEMRAEILEVRTTQLTDKKALAEKLEKVQVDVGKNAAAVQTKATAVFDIDGNGYGIYDVGVGVKYNGQFYKAGMVLGAEVKNGKVTTSIGFNAENFGWFNPVNGKMEPFMVAKNGQLFVRDAFIDVANIRKLVVGDEIKSANFDPRNRTGFRLDMRTGEMTSYGQGSGGYWVETNNLKQLFDSRGRLRIRMGFW